jgi:hypothetical protein
LSSNRSGQASRPAAASRTRRPRPLPPGDTLFTPDAAPPRQALEHRSATWLLWLHQLPRWVAPVLAAVLLIAGLAIGGVGGGLALAGLAVVLAWLAALSWPRLNAQGRALRVLAVACVLIIAVIRALHH